MGAVDIIADVAGLVIPSVPSAGVKAGVKAVDAAHDAYKAVDTLHDASKVADATKTIVKNGDNILDAADAAKDLKKASNIADAGKDSSKALTKAKKAKGWHVGDPIDAPTRAGTSPKWSTVRQRYWKNEAHYRPEQFNKSNLARTKRGLAPQQINTRTGRLESMELHHVKPQRDNGPNTYNNLRKVWPDEHAEIDSYRHVRR